ncbi:GerMN domain-containing protein [Acaricomes phytoseiuli]|uniref:GerMN domain-containing protein n=1 Tax=Acaricomes phytoseiuli TaxID=291968 RepID=UPI000376B76B|nr:GerMN domain-containing protein [Acaricomes phytoseiuli]
MDPGNDPINSALNYMMTSAPFDKSYSTPWSKPSKLAASISAQGGITVDVSADAFSRSTDRSTAELALQQLVYTATAAAVNASLLESAQETPVTILVDGHSGYEAFDKIKLDSPLTRVPEAQAALWLTDPQQSSVYKDAPVIVNGRVRPGTPAPSWTVRKKNSKEGNQDQQDVVAEGTADLVQSTDFATFSALLDLAPGEYAVEAYWVDPNDPGRQQGLQKKSFTIES